MNSQMKMYIGWGQEGSQGVGASVPIEFGLCHPTGSFLNPSFRVFMEVPLQRHDWLNHRPLTINWIPSPSPLPGGRWVRLKIHPTTQEIPGGLGVLCEELGMKTKYVFLTISTKPQILISNLWGHLSWTVYQFFNIHTAKSDLTTFLYF